MQLVKVGLCAFGLSGRVFHAPFLKAHPGFFLSAIVERSKSESREKYPDSKLCRSVEEMLAIADIDVVVVNTPVQTHFQYVKMALQSGKNVIVEKPFTINALEAEQLTELANEHHLFLSVYQNRRFDRDYLQVKKIIGDGFLGNLKEVEIRFDRFRTEPSHKEHKENPNLPGSGALHDLGAHLIDQATQLFGCPEKLFADVFSMKGPQYANDYFELILFYTNRLRVRLKSSTFVKEDHYAYKIHGDKGSFLQQRSDRQEQELTKGAVPVFEKEWVMPLKSPDGMMNCVEENDTRRYLTSSAPGDYMNYYTDVYNHIVFDEPLPSPAVQIIQNMKIIDAALQSAKEGREITL